MLVAQASRSRDLGGAQVYLALLAIQTKAPAAPVRHSIGQAVQQVNP